MQELQTMNTSNGSLPAVPEGSNTIIQRIHAAKLELEKASNDSERKEIWKDAKQAEKVAAALELTEIQVVAANLKMRCEREVVNANPSQGHGGDRRSGNFNVTQDNVEQSFSPESIRQMRQAHSAITDEEFEEAEQEATDNQEPLTRSYFKEKSAEKKELEKGNTMHTFGKQRNNTEEWYTPTDVIDKVHAVFGEIDLDPASNPVANEIVKAKQIYTKDDNGLAQDWYGKVFLNPPFGSDKISKFIDKLIGEYQSGNVSDAILLTESLSQPKWFISAIRACDAVFMAADRFYYWDESNGTQRGWSKGYLFYFGSDRQAFYDTFKDDGTILTRYGA